MLIFGGLQGSKRQWSSVDSCSVRVVGKLDFDFTNGACNTIKIESIIIIFFLKGNIDSIQSTTGTWQFDILNSDKRWRIWKKELFFASHKKKIKNADR